MTKDEELDQLRQENAALRTQGALLSDRISVLEAQQAKDNHNNHLPPCSDRFHRNPKSLRKKSSKKPGGQAGRPGSTLMLSATPDQVMVHAGEHCQHWQRELLTQGYQANSPDSPPEVAKKGQRIQSAARCLLDRLCMHQKAFLDNFAVPFDNSLAERDLRMIKFQQRFPAVSARLLAPWPSAAFAAISRPCASRGSQS